MEKIILHRRPRWSVVAVLAGALPFSALAQQVTSAGQADGAPALASPAPHDSIGNRFGAAAHAGVLADLRGGSETTHTDMTLSGTISGNVADRVVAGNNVITAGSFANMSGIPLVVQNTGANVLIQNAVIVNLKME